jgi:hypothetical protein
MKTTIQNRILIQVSLLGLLATLSSEFTAAFAQGTAFTYQGQLTFGTTAVNGSYDMTFALFNGASGAGQLGSTLTKSAVGVSNGVFTVTLDFGGNFPGADRWLEISVRTAGGGSFSTLSPRQKLTPEPYAVTAGNLTGTVPAGQLSGTVGNGQLANSAVTVTVAATGRSYSRAQWHW